MKVFWPKRKISLKYRLTRITAWFLLLLLLQGFFPGKSRGASSPTFKEKKALLILVNGITWEDLSETRLPFLKQFMNQATVALLSPRTAGTDATIYRSCLTLGAGSRAQADKKAVLGFNQEERWEGFSVRDWYQSVSGEKPQGEIFHLGVANLKKQNEKVNYPVLPGALGEELGKAGLKRAVLGNADTSKDMNESFLHREAVLIAMDEKGKVDFGNVGKEMLTEDKMAPFGLESNYSKLISEFWEVFGKASFIVVETGDTSRVDFFSRWAQEKLLKRYKLKALKRFDAFLARIIPSLEKENTLVIIASPSPPKNLGQPDELTPVILWGKGFEGGLATSATTKRKGLISNVDLAPTFLNYFSLEPPPHFLGSKIVSRPYSGNRFQLLKNFNAQSVKNDYLQPIMIISSIIFTSLVFLFTLAYLLLVKTKKSYLTLPLSGLLLAVLALPLSYFLLPLAVPSYANISWYLLGSFSLVFLLVLGSWGFRKSIFGPVSFLTGVTTILIGVDLLTGARLNINTIYGYSPIVGGRFYGLGNQTLAIFLASTLLVSILWLEGRGKLGKFEEIMLILFFSLVVLVVGFPKWGADVGGTITSGIAFSLTYLHILRKRIAWRDILLIALGIILVLSLFAAVDIFQSKSEETHLGKTVELVKKEGNSAFFQVVQRKLATNWRILKYSSWSYFFLIILGLLLFLRFRPLGEFEKLLDKYPFLAAGITGALAGGVIGFLTNDSGIVIPALILSHFVAAIFYLMVQEKPGLKVHPVRNTKVLKRKKTRFLTG